MFGCSSFIIALGVMVCASRRNSAAAREDKQQFMFVSMVTKQAYFYQGKERLLEQIRATNGRGMKATFLSPSLRPRVGVKHSPHSFSR